MSTLTNDGTSRNTRMKQYQENVLLVGLSPHEEASIRSVVENSYRFHIANTCGTCHEALKLIKNTLIRVLFLSTSFSDMTLMGFLQEVNEQAEVWVVLIIPSYVPVAQISMMAVEGINSHRVAHCLYAPLDENELVQIEQNLNYYRGNSGAGNFDEVVAINCTEN